MPTLPRSAIGPVVLVNPGDQFTDACRIIAIVWTGTTTSGDTVVLRHRVGNEMLWEGITNTTKTYLGINLGPNGEHCPNGFYLASIAAGTLKVYINQA